MSPFTIEEYQQLYLNEDRLQKCYDEKWFKLFVPKAYNGLELSMENGCRELLKIAEIQGGLGWTVNLGAGANWFSGFFEDEIAKTLFMPENAVIAGSGMTNGEWMSTSIGFEITGEWSKCTGANHATLFSLTANNSTEGSKIFVVPKEKVSLSAEKWPIMGMRNSSSFGIVLNKAKVPNGYDFQMNIVKNHEDYGVFHIPFQAFARLCMSASYLGVVKCLVNLCQTDLKKPMVLEIIEKDLNPLIQVAEEHLYEIANRVENLSSDGNYSEFNEDKMRKQLGENNISIFEVVQKLFLAGGLPFIEEDTLIHWAYRDVLTAVQHFMVKP
ncbi:MAG TPA: hypothetical protein VKX29_04630 [Brumimicrobium sp.]|nr:hypothetical protein [Brumimicrobium sp.]